MQHLLVLLFGNLSLLLSVTAEHNIKLLLCKQYSIFIAIFGWKMPAIQAFESIGNGLVYANWPIMWIVFNAM